ncbi:hypothetical protein PFICI_04764 [Pestalotiopsis fici W106-1]|uniref:Uncharacterized protein n=1 Tax=Pestalotiopsis fici (strain W106-1 / CGMCC3.15140) TaxID=1229662 RepID=W3X9V1_PESFW|nr:uncharacterized protein PFICI_04764 [Pestalotiopsis fici W106-1]ETS82888.1 hypothetical protein PFICI_04764 [Pestalotiopsis fici W106-1]
MTNHDSIASLSYRLEFFIYTPVIYQGTLIHLQTFCPNKCRGSENPRKPQVVITKNLPPSATRDTITRTYLKTKYDAGDISAALAYDPEGSENRISAREAGVKIAVDEALSKLG